MLSTCPKFEAHSFRIGGAVLEEAFLQEREAQMQAVLSAWGSAFNVRLDSSEGPEPLLAFLSDADGNPGECPTPRVAKSPAEANGKSGVRLLGTPTAKPVEELIGGLACCVLN